VPPEERPARETWEETVAILRRRGYLGGRTGCPPRHAVAGAWALVAAGLVTLAVGVSVGATVPWRPVSLAATLVLLLPLVLVALGAVWCVVRLAELLNRRGVGAGAVAAGGAVVAVVGAVAAAVVAGTPWVPDASPRFVAAAALGVVGAALLLRGVARAIVLRVLRSSPVAPVGFPGLWRVTVATVVAVALVAVAAAVVGRGDHEGEEGAPPLRVRAPAGRLAVVAVDGAAREEVLLAGERFPALRSVTSWRWAPLAEPSPSASLPVRWITLATGAPPARHGVATLRQVRVMPLDTVLLLPPVLRETLVGLWGPPGVVEEETVPAAHRRVPTVWEMASRAGVAVRVLGWWGSFPPRRVRGVVASERWLLTGEAGPRTVFPPDARLGNVAGHDPLDMDRRTVAALEVDPLDDVSLVMAYFPGWWLEERDGMRPPLVLARAMEPHLDLLAGAVERLVEAGFPVCLVGLEPGDGGWVAWSVPGPPAAPVGPPELVNTWLDALGLPPSAGVDGGVRRDLSGVEGPPPAEALAYGPPPPLASAAPSGEGAAQLELLRSLGYLQ